VTGGTAVARGSVPSAPRSGGGRVYVPGYYGGYWPWAFGGLGFGYGYYGGYYGGYYDPYYPWYPGYGPYGYAPVAVGGIDGSLRLRVQPVDAQVYVDGFYAGVVDDFNGAFERLHLQPGPHHVEVRAPRYETLGVDVMIRPDQTITLTRDLTRGQ
jgi:hypothetical protein